MITSLWPLSFSHQKPFVPSLTSRARRTAYTVWTAE
jgi:hypothetical protein